MPSPLLLAVDGNSLLHRAHHAMAQGEQRDSAGRPVWAIKGLISFVATAAARLTPDAVVIGFDCPHESVRRQDFAGYKAQRAEKGPELREQLDDAPKLLAAAGFSVVVPTGYEADDVLASCAAMATRAGWRTAVVTSDRDSFALICESTSVLRVLNGGIDGSPLLTPRTLPILCGVDAGQYRDFAALRGDTSDNLPGALGIGAKTAAKLLSVFAGVDDAYAAIDAGRGEEVATVIGESALAKLSAPQARANVARNQQLMRMRTDLTIPKLAAMRVPLDLPVLQAALTARDIRLGPSLWALTGQDPPAWYGERAHGQGPQAGPDGSGSSGGRRSDGGSGSDRRVITLPRLSRAARRNAALAAAGQLSLF